MWRKVQRRRRWLRGADTIASPLLRVIVVVSVGSTCPRRTESADAPLAQRLFQALRLTFALLELVELLLLGLKLVLSHLVLYMFLVSVYEQLLDYLRELAVFVQGLRPVLLELLKLVPAVR